MLAHLRANLWLLFLTLGTCCVFYPLALRVVGLTVFPQQAEGSLIAGKDGKPPVGSRLIAQPFGGAEYFQPRPSAVSYNATASGASNWAASNYLLRDRVARTLGTIARYKNSALRERTVQQDVVAWFAAQPNPVADWAEAHPEVAEAWVNADDKHKAAVSAWATAHPAAVTAWKQENPDAGEPKLSGLAGPFFKDNAEKYHKAWPKLIDDAAWSVEAVFFEAWLAAHPDAELDQVPADMVMASGSGLDPHITMKNAHYQAERVAAARAAKTGVNVERVRSLIDELLRRQAFAPLAGLAGGDAVVNVLELNVSLDARMTAVASR